VAEAIELIFVLPSGSLILDWAGPAEAFRIANTELPHAPPFKLRFCAPQSQALSSVGAAIAQLEPLPTQLKPQSWVILVGKATRIEGEHGRQAERVGTRLMDAEEQAVLQWLRWMRPGQAGGPGLRLVTVCSGALLAAGAGLLEGKRVTTHHEDLETLAALSPRAVVVPDRVFVQDEPLWSSAGVTAGIDLALHLIAEHCGPVVAARTAQRMAVALRRGPDDPQLSPFLAHRQHLNARLHRVQDAVSRRAAEAWDAQRMAGEAHTTVRTLNRLFAQHTGTTPLAYLRAIRLALARAALAAGATVAQAAERSGFHSDLQLRRAWHAAGLPGAPSRAAGLPGAPSHAVGLPAAAPARQRAA
jgi:transcriptional regulator GlxA family with amidase domain